MRWLTTLVLVGVAAAQADAAQFFVAPTGNDESSGTATAPWRSLQHAAEIVGPGDRVTVRAGSYAGFHLETSGTVGAPIEFIAEPGVVVNQPNSIRPQHGINLENASHVILDGFTVTGMERAGVRSVGVDGDTFASHVTIRNVRSYDNGFWGILTGYVHDLVIENNETSGSAIEHGIYVSNSGDRPIIRNNKSWGNDKNGIHINGDIDQGGDGIISDALVSGNIIFDNGTHGGSAINMDGVQNSRIDNNLIYNNHASGISLYQINGGGPSTGNIVVNNTVHQAGDGRWALNIRDGSTGNTALNNIFITEHLYRGSVSVDSDSLAGFVSDYNVLTPRFTTDGGDSVLDFDEWKSLTGNETHSLVANAAQLFLGAGSGDYHLLSNSPAVDKGTSVQAPHADFEGHLRPAGAAFDIGADEFLGAIPAGAGDYNNDGSVDAADYAMWRNSLGLSVTPLAGADGDGSGVVDAGDYAVWRANFGTNPTSAAEPAATVPEPGTAAMICVALAMMIASFARHADSNAADSSSHVSSSSASSAVSLVSSA
jgi:hypothetical protein